MKVIDVGNVNLALREGCRIMEAFSQERGSRNGPVRQLDEPLTTVYYNPMQRVLIDKRRDANPFFHLFESLWMLAGRNDVGYLRYFNSRIGDYSDDGDYFHGAYGYRWRNAFVGCDQLKTIIKMLKEDATTRRAVLQIWSTMLDLDTVSKDIPCNLTATFQLDHRYRLNMVLFNRSNDLIWGHYGANVVHFSMLQEYVAMHLGATVGSFTQITANAHIYEQHWSLMDELASDEILFKPRKLDPYQSEALHICAMDDPEGFDRDLNRMFTSNIMSRDVRFETAFFAMIVAPMKEAWDLFKTTERGDARSMLPLLQMPTSNDWRVAAEQFLAKRRV